MSDGSSLPFVLPQRVGRSAANFAVARAYFEAAEKIEARHPTQDIEALRLRCKGAMRIWVDFATIKDECRDISISQTLPTRAWHRHRHHNAQAAANIVEAL